jgi:hypothetical protein
MVTVVTIRAFAIFVIELETEPFGIVFTDTKGLIVQLLRN